MQRVLYILMVYSLNLVLCKNGDQSSNEFNKNMKISLKEEQVECSSSDDDSFESSQLNDLGELSLVNEHEHDHTIGLNDEEKEIFSEESLKQYISELAAGTTADLFGTNPHYKQPDLYNEIGRRFIPQYPYVEIPLHNKEGNEEGNEKLIPQMAPPELVLSVAKKSALEGAAKPLSPTDDVIRDNILRTGDYWNGAWREDVDPNSVLRTFKNKKTFETITAKILPDSDLYEVFNKLAKISPKMLYVVNKK